MAFETKSYRTVFEIKAEDRPGKFSGHASVFGNVDWYGDVVDAGAFKRTLDQRGPQRKVLWQHDVQAPIGKAVVAEDKDGLAFEAELVLDVPQARDAYALIKAGVIDQMSIGYDTVGERWEKEVRHITEARLWEISPVTFAANELALIDQAKGMRFNSALGAIINQRPSGTLDEGVLERAITILQELRATAMSKGDPGDHSPPSRVSAGPASAGQATDPLSSVHEIVKSMRGN